MLDENLPAYILKPSTSGRTIQRDLLLAYQGDDPRPAYTVLGADPASPSPAHKNCYAAAIFDAYSPEVLYGEVLARPAWTQPTLSADEIRRHGGVPPPPQPVLPAEFVVQLYSPDQQIRVDVKEGKWASSDTYEFSMPQSSFRTPSVSNLDRGQSDPASLAVTPKINFVWRRESMLGKDLNCFMTGRSTDTVERKRSRREPDIAVALWRSMRELTIYEPNLSRLEMEDPKGLEIVLLLSAVVIKDLYFGGKEHMRELFNIADVPGEGRLAAGARKSSSPQQTTHPIIGAPNSLGLLPLSAAPRPSIDMPRTSLPRLPTTAPPSAPAGGASSRPPPMADPRSQWELDAETARLKAQAEAEARDAARRRREKDKADEAERKRLQKMVEEEEKEARRRQAEIDKETERLRKMYGVQPLPSHTDRPSSPGRLGSNGLYMQRPAASSSAAVMMSGANSGLAVPGPKPAKKKSLFGLRSVSDDVAGERQRLSKKPSAMW